MPTIKEVIDLDKPLATAYADAHQALQTIGAVREADPQAGKLSGTTRYGLQKIRLEIALAQSDGRVQVTVAGSGDDAAGVGARDGVARLLAVMRDPASMSPDSATTRRGVTTTQLVWTVALFVLLIVGILVVWFGLGR